MALFDDPFEWAFNEDTKYEHLCQKCTVKAFIEILERDNIIIKDGIIASGRGQGFLCSRQI